MFFSSYAFLANRSNVDTMEETESQQKEHSTAAKERFPNRLVPKRSNETKGSGGCWCRF